MSERFRIFAVTDGYMAFVASRRGLRRTYLPARQKAVIRRDISADFPEAVADERLMPALAGALRRYFDGRSVQFDVELDLSACREFDIDVWNACHRLGYGETASYGSLAESIGRPRAARAVGSAMGRNPFPIVVPCHRVVASNGSLGGYSGRGGLRFKRRLLDMEAAHAIAD